VVRWPKSIQLVGEAVFYLGYLASELRRRKGRTFLTALGLGVGVGLVVAVSALSDGLDKAQDEVLEPLTGVGTDLTVARPLDISGDVDGGGGGPSETSARRSRSGYARRTAADGCGSTISASPATASSGPTL
jgi:hypothetical protein